MNEDTVAPPTRNKAKVWRGESLPCDEGSTSNAKARLSEVEYTKQKGLAMQRTITEQCCFAAGKWRCQAEPVAATQRAALTLTLKLEGLGSVHVPLMAKVRLLLSTLPCKPSP